MRATCGEASVGLAMQKGRGFEPDHPLSGNCDILAAEVSRSDSIATSPKTMGQAPFPLSLTHWERFMWRDRNTPGYPAMFSVWLALRGDVDDRILDQALAEASAWHPLLSAVISGHGRKARWTFAGSRAPSIEWMADSRSPIDPPDVSSGPGLRVGGSMRADGADLVFHFHHAFTDGVGGIEFLGDFFAAYSQLVAGRGTPEPVRPLDPLALLRRRVSRSASAALPRRLAHGAKLGAQFASALAFRPSAMAGDPEHVAQGGKEDPGALFRLPEVRLDSEQVAAIRERAHKADASVNDVLLAEVFLALRRWNSDNGGGKRFRLGVPMNLRTAEQAGVPAANVVGFKPLDRVVDGSSDFDELLAGVRKDTAVIKQLRQPSWLDEWITILASAPPLLDGLLKLPTALYTGILSNLGSPADYTWSHLPQEDGKVLVGDARLEGVGFAPPIRPRSALSLGITTYGGQLSITGKTCPFTVGTAGLERFLALLGDQLRGHAGEREAQPAGATG
jgi:hypothetical protein